MNKVLKKKNKTNKQKKKQKRKISAKRILWKIEAIKKNDGFLEL